MNKFIPLTLASVIVIAMIFAVTPIEYAQTTHAATTIVGANSVTSASIAANTIVSADISNTADITGTQILDGTLATADLNAAAGIVTGQIADGTLLAGDFSAGAVDSAALADIIAIPTSLTVGGGTAIVKITLISQADGANGWIPDAILLTFTVTAGAADIAVDSVIAISIDGDTAGATCSVTDVIAATSFDVDCDAAVANLAVLNIMILNP